MQFAANRDQVSVQIIIKQYRMIHTILEPTATLRDKVNLSLTETVTAVTCSASGERHVKMIQVIYVRDDLPAAFPAIGKRMRPTNPVLMCPVEVRPLMESTRNSAVMATSYSPRSDFGSG